MKARLIVVAAVALILTACGGATCGGAAAQPGVPNFGDHALPTPSAAAVTDTHLPGVADFLRWSGLSQGVLTIIDVGTDHDGVGLHVSAGYADDNVTVLVLDKHGPKRGSGPAIGGFEDLSLTDQFGHTYAQGVSGSGIKSQPEPLSGQDVPGYATFDPITGPAAVVGARLTLTGHQFDLGSDTHGLTDPTSTWQVTFALERRPTTHVQWARASITGATYTFNHVTITGGTRVQIGWTAQGAAVAAANAAWQPADGQPLGDCTSPFQPVLLDSTGREVPQGATLLSGGAQRSSTEDYVSGTLEYVVQPGRYRFVLLTPPGGHGFERDLLIP
jgi:hypothetical protein